MIAPRNFAMVLLLLPLAGCSSNSGDADQASSALTTKLDKWVTGNKDDSLIAPMELRLDGSCPTSYEIKSLLPDEKGATKGKSFLASVTLDFKSQAGTPTQRVLRYKIHGDEKKGDWKVFEESNWVDASFK